MAPPLAHPMCCLAPLPHQGALVVGQLLQHLQALPFLQLLPLHKPLQGALPARQLVPLPLAFPHGFQQCDLQECLCHEAGLHVVDLRNLLQMGGIAREGRRRQGTAGKGAGAVATASTVLPSKQSPPSSALKSPQSYPPLQAAAPHTLASQSSPYPSSSPRAQ